MTFVIITVVYFATKYYLKETLVYLMYANIAIVALSALLLSVSGIESAMVLGPYSLTLFILMFIELSIKYLRK